MRGEAEPESRAGGNTKTERMNRPDPDELLDKLQRDEAKSQRGKLKIFFGASAGVGKTYAMLQAARRRKEDGVDVVVGIAETHGRGETAALGTTTTFAPAGSVVEPALLSLLCRELNEVRKAAGKRTIDLKTFEDHKDTIISNYYRRSIGDLPELFDLSGATAVGGGAHVLHVLGVHVAAGFDESGHVIAGIVEVLGG